MCLQNLSYISRSVRVYLPVSCPRTPRPSFILAHSLLFPLTKSIRKGSKHRDSYELEWEGRFEEASRTALFCSSEYTVLGGLKEPVSCKWFYCTLYQAGLNHSLWAACDHSYECGLTQNLKTHCFWVQAGLTGAGGSWV